MATSTWVGCRVGVRVRLGLGLGLGLGFVLAASRTAPKKLLTYSLICAGTSRPGTLGSQHMAAQKNGTILRGRGAG